MIKINESMLMITGEDLGKAISFALKIKGRGAQARLAEALGIKPPSVSEMQKTGRLDKSHLTRLWMFFADVVGPEHWGLEQYPWAEDSKSNSNIEDGPDIRGEYPLISWVQAGEWMEIVDNFSPGDAEAFFLCPKKCSAQTFMLRVKGRSMEPKYQEGDLIYVDPQVQYQHNSNVVVKLTEDQEATFKRLVIVGGNKWLEPLNPDWPEKAIKINGNAIIVGVVIGKFTPD